MLTDASVVSTCDTDEDARLQPGGPTARFDQNLMECDIL